MQMYTIKGFDVVGGEDSTMKTKSKNNGPENHGKEINVEELPKDIQEALVRGIYGVHKKSKLLSEFLQANPSEKIAAYRKLKKMSQKELAIKADIRQADVSNAEKDIYDVRLGTLAKIAQALDIELEEIFGFGEGTSDKKMSIKNAFFQQ
jgi:DNA-binding XRE family transcriptional regulator